MNAMQGVPIRFAPGADLFYHELRANVDHYFASTGTDRHATPLMWVKVSALLTSWATVYVTLLTVHNGGGATVALALAFGLITVLLVFNIGHDATHDAISANPRVNRALAELSISLCGANAYLYRLVHNTPHPFPNVAGVDVTLEQVGSLLRLSPHQPLRRYHRWQHLYAPFLYALYSLFLVFVKDFKIFARSRVGNRVVHAHPRHEVVTLVFFKVTYLVYALILPLVLLPYSWPKVLLGFLGVHLVMGLVIAVVLQPVHLADDLHFSRPDEKGHIARNWALYQLEATKDYAPESRWASLFLGGLNTHAIHHLFPGVCHVHYRHLTRLLRSHCDAFGAPYACTTFFGAIAGHFRFLRLMGRRPESAVLPPGQATLISQHNHVSWPFSAG